jgi:CheY-like chemotaxis protein
VLIVDHDSRSAAALVAVLADHLEVTVSSDAAEAVARIVAGARFDVILCDLNMRAMNGAQIFAHVCAASPGQAARIVFLSGGTIPLLLAGFLSRVPNQCLRRPLDPQVVRALVDRRVAEELARATPESAKSG